MRKFWNYYKKLLGLEIMTFMAYRGDFLMVTLGSYGYTILSLIMINVITEKFDNIAGWSRLNLLFLFGYSQLVYYLFHMFFGAVESLSSRVIDGKLDMYLLKPLNTFLSAIVSTSGVLTLPASMLLALGVSIFALFKTPFDIPMLLFAILFLPVSTYLFLMSRLAIALLSFWLSDVWPLIAFFNQIEDNNRFPIDIYPKKLQNFLIAVTPVIICAYIPARFLFFGFDLKWFLTYVFLIIFFTVLNTFLWDRGLKNYSSASS